MIKIDNKSAAFSEINVDPSTFLLPGQSFSSAKTIFYFSFNVKPLAQTVQSLVIVRFISVIAYTYR